jgi:NADH-quinone oxidoreductase E subunit
VGHLSEEVLNKARILLEVYPNKRSALIPLCHLAQGQDGYLTPEAIIEIAELVDVTPAEVRGTASFYDMFHLEPVGKHVVAMCTNIACMLRGADELLEHAQEVLDVGIGGTTQDGQFTLEEAECLAGCNNAPCVQVNHRFFGPLDNDGFDELISDLKSGKLKDIVPEHGVLNRVERQHGLKATPDQIQAERDVMESAKKERLAKKSTS